MDQGLKREDERLDRLRRDAQAATALADRVAAQAAHDLSAARHQLKAMRDQNAALARDLAAIESSTSWKLTAPLRKGLTALPAVRRPLSVAVKLVWWSATLQLGRRMQARRELSQARAAAEQASPAVRMIAEGGEARRDHGPPPARTETVDVVVCVHNALADVQACLASLKAETAGPWRLILVDDGSASETQAFLAKHAEVEGATLIRNDQARGYTFAANQGMRASTAPWLVLLNSDTIVTPGWLDRLVAPAAADPKVGMVGPMSNTASWQSAPKILDHAGDWADNPLSPGLTVADMGALVADASAGQAMPLPFLNGFCMLIRRAMLDEIGLFDEETFGAGYGEENDLSIRARHAAWRLAVASGAYVFHAQSKSYSHERRKMLAERAGERLAAKHDAYRDIDLPVAFCRDNLPMAAMRVRIAAAVERDRLARSGRNRWAGRRLAMVLPIDREGGGGNVVRQELHALTRMGVDWTVVNLEQNQAEYAENYPDLLGRTLFAASPEAVTELLADPAHGFEVAVGTYYATIFWLPLGGPRPAYYIQDYEPLFFPEGDLRREVAARSYTAFEDFGLFTKSRWNAEAVEKGVGVRPALIGPSVDIDLFRPLPRPYDAAEGPVRVCAMVRPGTPRRGPKRTLQVLERLQRTFGDRIEVSIFGCDDDQVDPFGIPLGGATNYERMSREQMAWLLERSDVFLDLSDYQAMGLTALEAMASGCAVVVPASGGAPEFARHEHNALIVDTTDLEDCAAAAERLVADVELRRRLQAAGAADACLYPPETAAYRMMEALFG